VDPFVVGVFSRRNFWQTAAKAEEAALLEQFRAGPAPVLKAAE
jgi:hypothetical protein